MPRNFGEPSHTSIYEVAGEGRWRDRLETLIRPEPTKPPEYYWDLLAPRVSALEVWETVYTQALTGDNPVADFVKGSWLKPFLDALDGAERPAFESAYRSRVARAYPPRADERRRELDGGDGADGEQVPSRRHSPLEDATEQRGHAR